MNSAEEMQVTKVLPRKAAPEVIAYRRATCDACNLLELHPAGWRICNACHCVLDYKELIARAVCPLEKWR